MSKRTISELDKKYTYDELLEKINKQDIAINHITKLLVNQQLISKQLLETIDKQDKTIQKNLNDINSLLFYQSLSVSLNDKQYQMVNEIIDHINKITMHLFYLPKIS